MRFLRDVVGDPEKAEEVARMSPEEYAEHKRITIQNPFSVSAAYPQRRATMATRQQLQDRIAELEEENQSLTDKLDSIQDIVSEEDDEDEDDDD